MVGVNTLGTTPPHDIAAEQALLGACLTMEKMPEELELAGQDLYRPAHQVIWWAICELCGRGAPCSVVAVRAFLTEQGRLHQASGDQYLGDMYLVKLLEVAANRGSIRYYTEIVRDRALRRALGDAGVRIQQNALTGTEPGEVQLEQAERTIGTIPTSDRAAGPPAQTLDEFLASPEAEKDWIVSNLLSRDDRVIITGYEGLGKSTLCRQLAICTAAGMDPFDGEPMDARRVLVIDVENPLSVMVKRFRELKQVVTNHGREIEPGYLKIQRRPAGLDLATSEDRRWLTHEVVFNCPDLLVIGPAYKLHTGGSEMRDEDLARTVTRVLDDLRTRVGCALVLEHHSPNEQAGIGRPVRPFGSSLWRRWPEFGLGIQPHGKDWNARERLVKVVEWRGGRDERPWPAHLKSGGTGMPWVAAHPKS
jgi:replicative DNA helicase